MVIGNQDSFRHASIPRDGQAELEILSAQVPSRQYSNDCMLSNKNIPMGVQKFDAEQVYTSQLDTSGNLEQLQHSEISSHSVKKWRS